MKKLIIPLFCCIVLAFGCEKSKKCTGGPIDFENYNDVNTIFKGICRYVDVDIPGKTGVRVKAMGYILSAGVNEVNLGGFRLMDNPEVVYDKYMFGGKGIYYIEVLVPDYEVRALLKGKFDTCDLTRKCYLEGEVFMNPCCCDNTECWNITEIIVTDANDITFK